MNVPKSIFRQYDVRGIVGRELTPELARAVGRAFASVASERLGRAPTIAVGRDNRPSGPELSRGVRQGIVEAGGTAEILKPRPMSRRPSPSAPIRGIGRPARCAPMRDRVVVPATP